MLGKWLPVKVVAVLLILNSCDSRNNSSVNWEAYKADAASSGYSKLTSINKRNVHLLRQAWVFMPNDARKGARPSKGESNPIVIDGVMYTTSAMHWVYALDAATGARKWTYEPEIPDDVLQYACCDVNNRGVSYADGKLYIGRLDGKLTALDAKTGKELWTSKVVDYKQGSVITSPPLVVRDKVITGFGGGDHATGDVLVQQVEDGFGVGFVHHHIGCRF